MVDGTPLIRPTAARSAWVILVRAPTTALIERTAGWRQPPEHARKRVVRDWLGRSGAPPVPLGSLEGGCGGGWSVGPVAAGVGLVIGSRRARPGATRACALPRAAADRRATRGASGSARRPPGPRSSPAGAAARRSRGTPKCPARTRGGASQPRRHTLAARRRPAARRLPGAAPAEPLADVGTRCGASSTTTGPLWQRPRGAKAPW